MLNPEQITAMEQPQLLELCRRLNIPAHHKTGKQKLIEALLHHNAETEDMRQQKPTPRERPPAIEQDEQAVRGIATKHRCAVNWMNDKTYLVTFGGITESYHVTTPLDVLERGLTKMTTARYPAKDKFNGDEVLA